MASSRQRLIAEAYQRQVRSLRLVLGQRVTAIYRTAVGEVREVALTSIPLDDASHPPLQSDVVKRLEADLDEVPPIRVERHGGAYRLIDGRHRIEAARRLGRSTLPALVGPDVELDEAFAVFSREASPVIASAQASAEVLSAAYLRSLFAAQAGRTVEPAPRVDGLAGSTEKGLPLMAGMAAFAPMVKGQIGAGKTLAAAVEFGRYIVERFADAEITRVADEAADSMARRTPEVRGWRGFVAVGACDPCQAKNAGDHAIDVPMYRHGSCKCWREWFLGGVSLREVT